MHEHAPRHQTITPVPSSRSFGVVFGVVFGLIGAQPVAVGGAVRVWALIVGMVFLLLAAVAPGVLAPVKRAWMAFGDLMHRVVSPLALAAVFYLAVMPTGLTIRLLRKDPLRLRIDAKAKSYWIPRDPPGPDPESLDNQF